MIATFAYVFAAVSQSLRAHQALFLPMVRLSQAGGRREDAVWRCFGPSVLSATRKTPQRACKGCGTKVSLCVIRARNHVMECPPVKSLGLWHPKQGSIDKHLCRGSSDDEVADALARLIYSMNLPFTAVEHPVLRQFMNTLKPRSQPLSIKMVAGKLLRSTYLAERVALGQELAHSQA